MLEHLTQLCLLIGDLLLGWILRFSPHLALLLVAVITALLLTLSRPLTTNQDLLGRAKRDKKRLATLIREARRRRDKQAVKRHRATHSWVALKMLRAEGRPLLVALLPILVLATWCTFRLTYRPPRIGETLEVAVQTPVSAVGDVIHIVPVEGIECERGWVQPIGEEHRDDAVVAGSASWRLRATKSNAEYSLVFRQGDRTFQHPILVDDAFYAAPEIEQDSSGQWVTRTQLEPLKAFGVVPAINRQQQPWLDRVPWLSSLNLPSWLVAYLLIATPLVFLLKASLRIY